MKKDLYREFFERSAEALLIIKEAKFVDCNDATIKMLRYKDKQNLLCKTPSQLSPVRQPDGRLSDEKAAEMIAIAHREGSHCFEWDHLRQDGEVFPVEVLLTAVNEDGQDTILVVWRDISQRKKVEKTLQSNLQLLNSIIENQPSCLKIVKSDGTLLDMNPAGLRMISAKSKEEVIGMNVYNCIVADDLAAYKQFNEKICKGEKGTIIFGMKTLDGTIHYFKSIAVPLYYEPEKTIVQLGITNDITEELASQAKKLELENQLKQTQKMESIGTLAGGIAHDFNNILSAIIGYTELAQKELETPQNSRQSLNQVLKGANRAKELVQQILTFSRKSKPQIRPIRIQTIVEEALKLIRSSIPTTIEIQKDINPHCKAILADPTQIHQIIMNLCTNSYQAMRGKTGELTISLQPQILNQEDLSGKAHLKAGSYVRLSIKDSGEGMTKEVQEKIFEPYFTTKENSEGTGLGLAVVHGIVMNMNGSITVHSEPRVGTTFDIYFPITETTEIEDKQDDLAITPSIGNEHILLVDDDEIIVQMVSTMLEQFGYKVTAFSNSLDAIKAYKSQPDKFDLVITDMTMPHLSGEEIARQILAINPKVPIILCSGYSELMNKEKAMTIGIADYVLKPFKMKELAKTVHNAFKR